MRTMRLRGKEELAEGHTVSVRYNQSLNPVSFILEPCFAFILRASDCKMTKTWFLLSGNSAVKREIHTDRQTTAVR